MCTTEEDRGYRGGDACEVAGKFPGLGGFFEAGVKDAFCKRLGFRFFPLGKFWKKNSRRGNCPWANVMLESRIGKIGKVVVVVVGCLGLELLLLPRPVVAL